MAEKKQYKSVYFVGAGGIGMAALVRYYLSKGLKVAGYDRTRTALTDELTAEGAEITYDDAAELIPGYCRDKATTLVVYTPAVPSTHPGLTYFRDGGFDVMKRAQVLGLLTHDSKGLCFSGTHGKTTTSSMAAHILHSSEIGCNAFLGGISGKFRPLHRANPARRHTHLPHRTETASAPTAGRRRLPLLAQRGRLPRRKRAQGRRRNRV